jgi:alkanesulfonate monooxygenase SsuD/methylene tetrahydromethanopterin reductase-like flavin-dependent oxidoreductase (luciferase family)
VTVSFGIFTPPMQVGYADLQRVWREADAVPQIEHAWLFDHLMPIGGDPDGPAFEGWTLLSAFAAQTERRRLGLLVTSNRFRPPAVLAKMAATVDVVSHGRLDFGIGVGSRPEPGANREYPAHGLPFAEPAQAVAALAEALSVIRRLWTSDQPFDVGGEHVRLTGAFCNPKPVQLPGRRPGRRPRPGSRARPVVRRGGPRPGGDHPLAGAPGRLRAPGHHPGRRPAGDRRRVRPPGAGASGALPAGRRPLGRRRGDRSHDVTTEAPHLS